VLPRVGVCVGWGRGHPFPGTSPKGRPQTEFASNISKHHHNSKVILASIVVAIKLVTIVEVINITNRGAN
jgi:hypothetical protein